MCNLTRDIPEEKIEGYKIVAIDSVNKKYSIAMGFCYDDFTDEAELITIPEIKKQKRLSDHYVADILQGSNTFSAYMIRRTAIFNDKDAAVNELNEMISDHYSKNFIPKIFKAEVSKEIMQGLYGSSIVFAGRQIRFLEMVQ